MHDQDRQDVRRAEIRATVVREATRLRNRRRTRRAAALCGLVLAAGGISWGWMVLSRGPSGASRLEAHQPPHPSVESPRPVYRELTSGTSVPTNVVIIAGWKEVRPLVSGPPVAVRYLDDDELLKILDEAGQPAAVVHAGGVTRVVPFSNRPQLDSKE